MNFDPRFTGTFFGHTLKFVEGQYIPASKFNYEKIYDLFKFVKDQGLDCLLLKQMIQVVYEHPQMDFESVLVSINFKRINKNEVLNLLPFLKNKFKSIRRSENPENEINWLMGAVRKQALGNISLKELFQVIIQK